MPRSHVQLVVLEYAASTVTYRWPAMQGTLWDLARANPALAQLRRRPSPGHNGKVVFTDYPAGGETLADWLMVCQVQQRKGS